MHAVDMFITSVDQANIIHSLVMYRLFLRSGLLPPSN